MAKKFNPFHHWLGLGENLIQPNHFQLFGVKPNSDDPIGFRKNIHHRAKAMLKKLEGMSDEEVGEQRKLHTRLRRHIVKAHETLLDDKLRAAYLKGLRQKAREQKGSAKPLAVPPPQINAGAANEQAASQTSKGEVESLTIKGSGNPTIKQSSNSSPAEQPAIPMAIPLSKPVAPVTPEVNSDASGEASFDNLESETIAIRPGRIKRKKSPLIPIALVVMTLFCIAGIGALVTNFGNAFGFGETPVDPSKGDTIPGNHVIVSPEEIRDPVEVEVESNEDVNEDVPELAVDNMVTAEEIAANMPMEAKSGEPSPPQFGQAETTQPKSPETKASPNANSLTAAQLHSARYLFDRARNEMKRGQLESASRQYDMVESILQGRKVNRDQIGVTEELKNGRRVIKHLQEFLAHVMYSAQSINGGDLEPEPGVFVGFIEGRQDDVVLRMGENVEIPYRSLNPGLAMIIASKKGAKNVPSYRLDQAAYRIIHSMKTPEANAKTEGLIAASEADGYDALAIRGFWNPKVDSAMPDFTRKAVTPDKLKELSREIRGRKYKSAARVDPQLASQFAMAFSSAAYDDPAMKIAALNESILLAEKAGDAAQVMDLVNELNNWTQINPAEMKASSLARIAKSYPPTADYHSIGIAFYEFLKSPDAGTLKKPQLDKLGRTMLTFVEGNRLLYLKRLISQTMN